MFLEGPDFYSPDELDYRFDLSDEKAIINVGSVGQPRDRDPRSSFVIVHTGQDVTFANNPNGGEEDGAAPKPQPAPNPGGFIECVRLPYDVDSTVRKVEQIAELDNFLGTRLLDGR